MRTRERREGPTPFRDQRAGRNAGPLCCLVLVLSACYGGTQGGTPPHQSGAITKPISFAILEDYDKGQDLAQVARDFGLFRELGVRVWRGSFGWDDYEPARGQYDLEWLESFVRLADSMGISLRPYLGYTPGWASQGGKDEHAWNDPPRRGEDWVRFAGAVAQRLKMFRNVLSYEIYNEENTELWWEGSAAEYAEVLRAGAAAVRAGDPEAKVLLGGLVWPDLGWIGSVCSGGKAAFDILPFHAYPETWTPDSVEVENYLGPSFRAGFLPEADRLCGRKPIWINEAGFATTEGKTEAQQAEWWVRAVATFLAEPRVEEVGIYEIKDQPLGTAVIGETPNYYLGLVRRDGTPKLAFETVKLLIRLFGSDSITVADPLLRVQVKQGSAGRLYSHLFIRPDGTQLIFIWDKSSSPTVELTLPRPAGRVTVYGSDAQGSSWQKATERMIREVKLVPGRVRIFEVERP